MATLISSQQEKEISTPPPPPKPFFTLRPHAGEVVFVKYAEIIDKQTILTGYLLKSN